MRFRADHPHSDGHVARGGLRRRVRFASALLLVIVLAALGVALYATEQAHQASHDRSILDPAATRAANLLADYVDEETGVRGFIITGQRSFLRPYDDARLRIPRDERLLKQSLRGRPALTRLLDEAISAERAWSGDAGMPELTAALQGDFAAARQIENSGVGRVRFDALRTQMANLQQAIVTQAESAAHKVDHALTLLLAALIIAVVITVTMVTAVVVVVGRWLLRPFDELRTAVDRVARGEHDVRIPNVGPPELAALAASTDEMRSQLVEALTDAERNLQALSQQGPAVVALRDALAPSSLRASGLVLHGRLDPAEGVLAGDWFDSLGLPDGRVGIILGDVSGHGPEAGVYALRLKQLLTAALTSGLLPGEGIGWVVEQLGDTGEMFATAIVAIIDPVTGRLDYANAGHPDALVVHRDASQPGGEAASALRLEATGPMLSSLLAAPGAWPTRSVQLDPGDLFIAFTDGLVEARDAEGHEFGIDRLAEEMLREAGRDPTRLLDDTFAAVKAHASGRAGDDRTAIALVRDPGGGVQAAASTEKAPPIDLVSEEAAPPPL